MIGDKQTKAFSLVEILVAMSLFLTCALVMSDLFLRNSQNEKKYLNMEKSQMGLSLAINQISSMLRDYPLAYELNKNRDNSEIYLKGDDDEIMRIFCDNESSSLKIESAGKINPLTGSETAIKDCSFDIWPKNDPFSYDWELKKYAADNQPLIRIWVLAESNGESPETVKNFSMQTMVSSRIYGR